jgi:hypothetical protein
VLFCSLEVSGPSGGTGQDFLGVSQIKIRHLLPISFRDLLAFLSPLKGPVWLVEGVIDLAISQLPRWS